MPRDGHARLCSYYYDPLDRLVGSTTAAQANIQRFYQQDRLVSEVQGVMQRSIMQHRDQLLAQQQRQSGTMETRLLATDHQRSVLKVLDARHPNPFSYTPYGHRPLENELLNLLGFNGERPDPVTGWYLLGNGYRAYNPVLMRFNSPDSWSPFEKGGLHPYQYCGADPVNYEDRSGRWRSLIKFITRSRSRAIEAPISLSPPPYTKLDINTVSETASQSIITAKQINYSGQKLKSLERSLKKLKQTFAKHPKLTLRAQKRLIDDLPDRSISDPLLYLDAQKTVATELDRRANKVINKTTTLNDRIRRSPTPES
jgi:RHS repeat-associated protein